MKRIVAILLLCVVFASAIVFLEPEFTNENIINFSILFAFSVLITVLVYSLISSNKDKRIKYLENRLEVWNNISYHVKKAGDEAMNDLPVGIMIIDDEGEIKWANPYAKTIFQNKLLERPLSAIHNELYNQIKNENNTSILISVYDRKYDVLFKKENNVLYFFDVTLRERIQLKYRNRTTALGIIYLDNMEESLSSLDVQEKSELRGKYLGEISDWVSDHNGYLKSYVDDRLVMVLDRENLDQMIKEKFDVLSKIRNISQENHLRVTTSIGIACWDLPYEELGSYAQNAIDLAEKRGGDQVVVNIENEKIQYFGAKTNTLEKNSKVYTRLMAQTLKDTIAESSKVIIIGHANMDVDAYGGTIGLLKMSLLLKDDVKVVIDIDKCDDTVKRIIELNSREHVFLNKYMIPSSKALEYVGDEGVLLIVVDTQSPKISMNPEVIEKSNKLVVIDHHRQGDNTYKDTVFSYVDSSASSSVELVTEMIQFFGNVEITGYEATIMLAGMIVDTNDFTFRTGANTFEVASLLKEYGADMVDVRIILRENVERHMLILSLISKVKIVFDKYAIVVCDNEKIYDRVLLAQVSERLLDIAGVGAAFTIGKVSEGMVGISARSYQTVNVQILMEELGGGGHFNGAASQMKSEKCEDVYDMLYGLLENEQLQEGDEVMKVILLEDVKGKGNKDDIIDVANGYGNFLISSKKAIEATQDNIRQLKEDLAKAASDAQNHLNLMLKLKEEIDGKSVKVYIKMGEEGKSFGSVTSKQVVEEMEKQYGIHLDKRKLQMPAEINSLGIYEATVDLHKDVEAKFEIHVLEK